MVPYGIYIKDAFNWVKVEEIANIECWISKRKHIFTGKLFTRNISNIYVSTFINYLLVCFPDVSIEDIGDIICQISTILFNNIMTKIYDICVRITGYLFQGINIYQLRINSQHSMLDNPVFQNISIDTQKQERFTIFMLACGV